MMKRIIPVLAVLAAYLHSFPSLTHVRAYASSSVTTATTKTNLVVLSSTLIFGSSFVEGIIDPDESHTSPLVTTTTIATTTRLLKKEKEVEGTKKSDDCKKSKAKGSCKKKKSDDCKSKGKGSKKSSSPAGKAKGSKKSSSPAGKAKGKGKKSSSPTGKAKGKGKKKGKGGKKKKCKKSKGSKKEDKKECKIPADAKKDAFTIKIKGPSDTTEKDLNAKLFVCVTKTTEKDKTAIFHLKITELKKINKACENKCEFEAKGTVFFQGNKNSKITKEKLQSFAKDLLKRDDIAVIFPKDGSADTSSGKDISLNNQGLLLQDGARSGADVPKAQVKWERVLLVILTVGIAVAVSVFVIRRRNQKESNSYEVHYHVNGTSSKLDTTADLSFLNEYEYEYEYDDGDDNDTPSKKNRGESSDGEFGSSVVSTSRDSALAPPRFPISTRNSTSEVDVEQFFSVAKHPAKVDGRLGRTIPRVRGANEKEYFY